MFVFVSKLLLFKDPKAGEAWDDDDKTFTDVCNCGGGDDIKLVDWFLFDDWLPLVVVVPLECDAWGSVEVDEDDIESEL